MSCKPESYCDGSSGNISYSNSYKITLQESLNSLCIEEKTKHTYIKVMSQLWAIYFELFELISYTYFKHIQSNSKPMG